MNVSVNLKNVPIYYRFIFRESLAKALAKDGLQFEG